MWAVIPLIAFVLFGAGMLCAYIYVGQTEYTKCLDLEVQISTLRARDLPPRVLEIWTHIQPGERMVMLGSIDADLAVEALALVGAGVRTFSEDGLSGVLTRREVARLRKELIQRQLCNWNPAGRNQGVVWTAEGQALLKQCQNEGVRTHTHALHTAKRHPRVGVGEGNYARS